MSIPKCAAAMLYRGRHDCSVKSLYIPDGGRHVRTRESKRVEVEGSRSPSGWLDRTKEIDKRPNTDHRISLLRTSSVLPAVHEDS